MKNYLEQFYSEGLATTFFLKPIKYVKKVIKNKVLLKMLCGLIKIIYTILMLILAWFVFWDRYPL